MQIATVADLLDTLRTYRLLSPQQTEALAKQALPADARAAARTLVQRGWLTTYQVNEIFLGRGGNLVLGSYVLLESLGEGGMGQVFKARNWKLGQTVAIKLIRKERLANPAAVKRFRREIQAAAKLKHPNIVRALDADEAGGTHFFVMEYVAGQDLNKLVKTQGPLDMRTACEYIRQAALGLQHAHECRMVHRDIKPHNLLVTRGEGRGASQSAASSLAPDSSPLVKILDLGLARIDTDADGEHSSTMTQEGTVVGTPDYIAPEQGLDSHGVDIRGDLYSLGCTLYFLLTGRPPFPGGTFMEKLLKHQQQRPPSLRQTRADVSPEVDALVARLLAKRPEDRYPTPVDLINDLDALLSGSLSTSPGAAAITLPPEDIVPSPNVFAEVLQSSATQALVPEIVKRSTLTPPDDGGRALRLGLVSAGVLIAAVLLMVTAWSVLSNRKPADPEPAAQEPIKKKRGPSLMEISLAQEKARVEEERKQKEAEVKRLADADEALKPLAGLAADPKTTFASFAKQVAAFKAKHGGTPASIRAAELLMKLPSPLDQLDPAKIPEDAKAAWKASGFDGKDVVAVLGEHRRRLWVGGKRMTMSANGNVIATVGDDEIIGIWDTKDWNQRCAIRSRGDRVEFVALSPQGDLLLEGGTGAGGTPRIWDMSKQSIVWELKSDLEQATTCGVFSADGKRALTGRNSSNKGTLQLWDVSSGRETARFEDDGMLDNTAVAFLPDQKRVVSANSDGKIRLWNLEGGKPVATLAGHQGGVTSVAVSADGKKILSAAPSDQESPLRLWDVESGQDFKIKRSSSVANAIFTLDGQHAITSGDSSGNIRVHDLSAKEQIREFAVGLYHNRCGVALLPNSKHLVSLTDNGMIRLWDVATGKEVQPLSEPVGRTSCLSFSLDATKVVSGHANGSVLEWKVNSLLDKKKLTQFPDSAPVSSVAYSPDEKLIACSALGLRAVKLLATGQAPERVIDALTGVVISVTFSADGSVIGLILGDKGVDVLDVKTGERRVHLPVDNALSGSFGPSRSNMAIIDNTTGTLQLWDAVQGARLWSKAGRDDPSNPVNPVFSPDGMTIATGGYSGHVKIWNAIDGREKLNLPEASGRFVAFSPDGSLLATGSLDGRIGIVNSTTGTRLLSWQLPGPVHGVAFAADGRHLATANGNGTVYILRLEPPPGAPVDEAWMKFVAALPGAAQVDVIRRKLQELNPGFDGKFAITEFADGKLTRLTFTGKEVVDIAPLGALRDLRQLEIPGTSVTDLSPLAGLKLKYLNVDNSPVRNLKPLEKLSELRSFHCYATPVEDLAPLKNLPLERLVCRVTKVRDFTPIVDCPLRELLCDFVAERDAAVLRRIKTLQTINDKPAADVLRGGSAPPPGAANRQQLQQLDAAKALGIPVQIENSIGMTLNPIPARRFLMGSPENEPGRYPIEGPPNEVSIWNSFHFGVPEVTPTEYEKITHKNPSKFNKGHNGGPDHPVEMVTGEEALVFCRELSDLPEEKKAGRVYRLPIGAEWEYACLAGTRPACSFGDDASKIDLDAWYTGNAGKGTRPVARELANAWGLCNMHGNVFEFCADW